MKKIIFSLLSIVFFTTNVLADTWHDHFAIALEREDARNYEEAESEYKIAFDLSLEEGTPQYYICIERARMLSLMGYTEEALTVVNKAIESEKLVLKDKTFAFLLRSQLYARMDNLEEFKKNFDYFGEINPDRIEIVENESKTIFRNLPNYEFVREMLKNYYISSKYCKNKEDLHFIGEDKSVCIVYKTNLDCGCGCGGAKKKLILNETSKKKLDLNHLGLYEDIKSEMGGMSFDDNKNTRIQNCCDNCDSAAAGAILWANWNISNKTVAAGFTGGVETLRRICRNCCASGDFYEACVKPLLDKEGILARFGRGVDPAND